MKLKCNWINVTNYFNNTGKERLREALERGDKVMICVDCIGHNRSEMVEAEYVYWLRDIYGGRLHVDEKTAWGAVYYLQQESIRNGF